MDSSLVRQEIASIERITDHTTLPILEEYYFSVGPSQAPGPEGMPGWKGSQEVLDACLQDIRETREKYEAEIAKKKEELRNHPGRGPFFIQIDKSCLDE